MAAQRFKREPPEPREPRVDAWRALAHGLLTYGGDVANGSMTHDRFWPACRTTPRRPGSKSTYSRVLDDLSSTRFFARITPTLPGPDTFGPHAETTKLRFGPGAGLVLSVSIGTESIRAALVDANGWLVDARHCAPTGTPAGAIAHPCWHAAELQPDPAQMDESPVMIGDRIALTARAVCLRAMSDQRLLVRGALPLLGVAVAWPAPVGRDKELNGWSFSHPGWNDVILTELVAQRLQIPVQRSHAINDANAVAVSVAFDDVRRRPTGRTRTTLALRIGGGLGAGTCVIGHWSHFLERSMFLAARLIEGDGGYAGELGHLPVAAQHVEELRRSPSLPGLAPIPDLSCSCQRTTPCLQTYASATAFVERLVRSGIGIEGLPEGRRRAKTSVMHQAVRDARDRRQLRAKRDIGRMLGRALASPVLMLNPSLVAVGGSMADPEVVKGIDDERARWAHAHNESLTVHVIGTPLHADEDDHPARDLDANKYSAARGAALVVFRSWLYRRLDRESLTPPFGGLNLELREDDVRRWQPAGDVTTA